MCAMSVKLLVAILPLLAPLVAAEPATFTHYGSGDSTGSQNCANPPADRPLACGAGTTNVQGYTAAISQNLYGAGPGAGAGPGCGKCWELTINSDENGGPIAQKTINVTVNNLCPAQGNEEWCDIPAGGTNQHGGQVHFDICSDNGGSNALFASVGAGKGTATQIDCGSGTAAESSSAATAPSSTAQPTSPASAAPTSASSYAATSSAAAAAPSSSSGSQGSGSQGSGSQGSASQGSSPEGSSAAAATGPTPPRYKPSLLSHPAPSFAFPSFTPSAPAFTPHATPSPGHHHAPHSGSGYGQKNGGGKIASAAAAVGTAGAASGSGSGDECAEGGSGGK